MSRGLRIAAAALLLAALLALPTYSQMVVSAGANSYVGSTGLMFGGGLGFEYWRSLSDRRASEGLMMGLGLEYVSLTTEVTKTRGNGWIFPFTLKYGFPVRRNVELGLGGGVAMVLNDVDVEDYFGDYYLSSELGGAPFAEAGLVVFTSPQVNLQFALRGGALFNESGAHPFVGIKAYVGYYARLPERSDESDD